MKNKRIPFNYFNANKQINKCFILIFGNENGANVLKKKMVLKNRLLYFRQYVIYYIIYEKSNESSQFMRLDQMFLEGQRKCHTEHLSSYEKNERKKTETKREK